MLQSNSVRTTDNKLLGIINQYAWNKPASWSLNVGQQPELQDKEFKGLVTSLLKPLLRKNFGRVAWTPFVIHWSFYGTVLPGDKQM